MKKAILCLIAAVSLLLPVSAVAAPVSVETPIQEENATENTLPVPISVERKNIDGVEYLVKVYDLPANTPQEQLVEEDFVLEDFLFSYIAADKQLNENKDTKEVTEDAKAEGGSKNLEDVIKLFPATKPYDKDGYQGTLTLDTGSIVTEVAGYTTKNYTVSATKEYPGLMYADPSYVAQSTVKDGYILKVSEDLLSIMEITTGQLPKVFALSMQDITPYGNNLYHLNSILQPATATTAPVVGVAITTETAVPGCATGATNMLSIDEAARFILEVAKAYTKGECSFYDEKEYAHLHKLYGSMEHLRTFGIDA